MVPSFPSIQMSHIHTMISTELAVNPNTNGCIISNGLKTVIPWPSLYESAIITQINQNLPRYSTRVGSKTPIWKPNTQYWFRFYKIKQMKWQDQKKNHIFQHSENVSTAPEFGQPLQLVLVLQTRINRNPASGWYISHLPTPLSCVLSYLRKFLKEKSKLICSGISAMINSLHADLA